MTRGAAGEVHGARSAAFLLAQVGGHAAARFGEKLAALELTRPHAGVLRVIAARPGLSQQELATELSIVPSRLVSLVDELEEKGLVERRDHPEDRRVYSLHMTARGARAMADIGRVARAHEEALCKALSAEERAQLVRLLERIADEQGLTPGVHPGFRRLAPGGPPKATRGTR
ncbi:MAG TPA: MarR family transcriptional regulator [Polyangiaceae bacterium]|jgi:DNA-binding MarR family transcriptional regulator